MLVCLLVWDGTALTEATRAGSVWDGVNFPCSSPYSVVEKLELLTWSGTCIKVHIFERVNSGLFILGADL